jgi:solute carrier family 25 aspartate/glutamate transporter 12/13
LSGQLQEVRSVFEIETINFANYVFVVVGTTCIFPVDMVKTRLQASKGIYSGPVDAFLKIIRTEGGFGALYRGLPPNLIGVTPEKAIKLAANEFLRERFERDDGSIELKYEVLAGGGAGFCQVIATNPMEITKIRMQMQATLPVEQRRTTIQVVKEMGIKGLYTGTLATLTRDVPFSVLFFPAYANLKSFLAIKEGPKKGQNTIASQLLAGGAAGCLAAGAVTPTDVVKTRLQLAGGMERYKNMFNAYPTILREEGFSALYKGAVPRMVVVGPLFAITLLAFEAQKEYMIRNGML